MLVVCAAAVLPVPDGHEPGPPDAWLWELHPQHHGTHLDSYHLHRVGPADYHHEKGVCFLLLYTQACQPLHVLSVVYYARLKLTAKLRSGKNDYAELKKEGKRMILSTCFRQEREREREPSD